MKRLSVFLAVLLLAPAAPAAVQVQPGDRVLLMGDSEAFLLGRDFPAVLPPDVVFKPVASPGSSVISWSEGQPLEWAQVFSFRPNVILVSLGANDACTGPSVVRNEPPYLERFLRKLRRTKAREIVWVGPPKIGYPVPDRKQCTATRAVPGLELFVQMVRATGVPYLDAREVEIDMWSDRLHCSRPQYPGDLHHGCLTWAKWIWGHFEMPSQDGC
jgi:lysophospholipase L1-like esterase